MITREGMETAMLMNAADFPGEGNNIIAGAAAGTLSAAFIAWLWSRYGYRVNLSRFFQVTAVFLLVFVVQLLIYGFHELAEANVLPNSEALHWATEAVRSRRRLRSVPDLPARHPAAWVAGDYEFRLRSQPCGRGSRRTGPRPSQAALIAPRGSRPAKTPPIGRLQ
jgi:FTR1 family protein